MRAAVLFIASAGFVGYIPVASGTFGSLVAIPLYWGFDSLQGVSPLLTIGVYALAVVAACWVAGRAEVILQEHDSHAIVIDEVVGYLAATLFLTPTWEHTLVAFFIFRVLDVVKPFPAGYVDRHLPGGPGVVLDDVISGVYANFATRLLLAVV